MNIFDVRKVIILPDDSLELLEFGDNQTSNPTLINGVIIRCSDDGLFHFVHPPNDNSINFDYSVRKDVFEYLGFYKNINDEQDMFDYKFPIAQDWVYEENGEYKYSEISLSSEIQIQDEIIMN